MYFHFHPTLFLILVFCIFVVASYEVKPDTFELDFSRSTGSLVVASNITKCHCKKFELTSHGRALAWQKSKLGKYDHVPFSVASKDLFYNFYQKQYLFWAEDKPGYWMFGPNPTQDSGGIVNKGCHDSPCPIDGSCKENWLYTNGSVWEADSSINLKCLEFADIFDDKTASLRYKPSGGNNKPSGGNNNPSGTQTGPNGKRVVTCDVKSKSPRPNPRSGTRDSLPSNRQGKGGRGGKRGRRNKYPNTCSCFKKRDCKSRKCSRCPNALRCGNPIRKRCKNDLDCCSGKCVRNKCSNCDCLGSKCKRNTQCCSGNCVKRVCQSSDNCLPKMKRCDQANPTRKPKGTKTNNRRPTQRPVKETNSNRTCCEGLVCINKKCQEQSANCTEDGGACTKKADCCNKFCYTQGNRRTKGNKQQSKEIKGVCRGKEDPCQQSGSCRNETVCCSKTCVKGRCKPQEQKCIPGHHGAGTEEGPDQEGDDILKCRKEGRKERRCCAPYECEGGKCVPPKCKQENRECKPNSQNDADRCCVNEKQLKCVKRGSQHKCVSALQCLRKNRACTPNSAQTCCSGCKCQRSNSGRSIDGAKEEKAAIGAHSITGMYKTPIPEIRRAKCKKVNCNKQACCKKQKCINDPKCKDSTTKRPNTTKSQPTKKSTTKDPGRTTKDPRKTTKDDGKTKTTRKVTKTTRKGPTDEPGRTTQKPTGEFRCKGRCRRN